MPVIQSKIDTNSEEFIANEKAMRLLVDELNLEYDKIIIGDNEQSRKRHIQRGKMLVRDRIKNLIDVGSDFFDLSALAAHNVYNDFIPAAGIVTGVGSIHGIDCMIVANDATVKGGTYYPITVKKHLRAQTIAIENQLNHNTYNYCM